MQSTIYPVWVIKGSQPWPRGGNCTLHANVLSQYTSLSLIWELISVPSICINYYWIPGVDSPPLSIWQCGRNQTELDPENTHLNIKEVRHIALHALRWDLFFFSKNVNSHTHTPSITHTLTYSRTLSHSYTIECNYITVVDRVMHWQLLRWIMAGPPPPCHSHQWDTDSLFKTLNRCMI